MGKPRYLLIAKLQEESLEARKWLDDEIEVEAHINELRGRGYRHFDVLREVMKINDTAGTVELFENDSE
ncbi:hypothetical protein [Paenibacillus dendritiformis]|uniref:hypothetical protein n=1 Tax=Paenibacillus dendritiformis TaxID=130049 RepID=UPI00387E0EFE